MLFEVFKTESSNHCETKSQINVRTEATEKGKCACLQSESTVRILPV